MSLQGPPQDLVNQFPEVFGYLISLSQAISEFDPSTQFTSWWRSDSLNRSVGGDPHSQHLFGFAFDLVGNRSREVQDALNRIGLVAVAESDHLHVQLFPAGTLESAGFFGRTIEV